MMRLPDQIREQFREFGRSGGRARAKRLSAESRARIARAASVTRWTRTRFGVSRFEELGLPGADIVDAGLRDVIDGVASTECYLIAIAAPRLRREGVPVPRVADRQDPEWSLFRLLEREHGDLAHARYNALLEQLVSFADACQLFRWDDSKQVETGR